VTTVATTTTTATTTAAPTMALTVFEVDNGLLRPRVTKVPRTAAVAGAALGALGIDASVSIANGTATVALDRATQGEQAEIVYTLTQFPTIKRVDVAGRKGLTRDDFASYVPPILIESPAAGAEVPSTFRVSGTASVFEATLVVQLVRAGKVVAKRNVTASEGAPGRGTFATTLHATPGEATVSAFAPSAADGSPQHEVDVAVMVVP
jgi:immunoglobulin-like protein involved in spore germination